MHRCRAETMAFFAMMIALMAAHVTAMAPQLEVPVHDPVAAMRGLIHRRLGPAYNDQIALRVIPAAEDGFDMFEIGSAGDKVEIAGNSATAMTYGLQWYFKTVLNTQTDWDNHKLQLPPTLPKPTSTIRQKRASKYTYYQNVCTVSYSSWTWGWEQWEKHIDWMALNGINIPLAFTGQEKVWQNVFKNSYNISDAGLNKFFAGSAFLAWGRMGNIRGSWVKGPLPQQFIDDQFALQLRILARYREFGMIPALPAFAGHIPEEFHVKYPHAKWSRAPKWNNFPDEFCCVYMLEPDDPLYLEVGKKFIEEQIRLYNYTSSLYQCDTYNEMDPASPDPKKLAESSKAVIDSMTAADPKAVWLMQGWLFLFDFWKKDRVQAYLSAVPNDKMIILDLYADANPVWNKVDNYFGKSWIYCVLHNFGGNTAMRGNLGTVGKEPVSARHNSNGTMIGVGLTMEGIYQNYVMYDLSLQMAWEDAPLNIPVWIKEYASRRYHSKNQDAQRAWSVLQRSVYNTGADARNIVLQFPRWDLANHYVGNHVQFSDDLKDRNENTQLRFPYDHNDVVTAWKYLLAASTELASVDTFRHDLTDVTRLFLSDQIALIYIDFKKKYMEKKVDPDTLCSYQDRIIHAIEMLDELLATNEDFLLGNWIGNAKALAKNNTKLAEYFEYEARNQITRWGDNNGNQLHDYAGKEWAGLVKNYYLGRWRIWLKEVCLSYKEKREMHNDELFKAREAFELGWQLSHEEYPRTVRGDTVEVSKRIYAEYVTAMQGEEDPAAARYEQLLVKEEDVQAVE